MERMKFLFFLELKVFIMHVRTCFLARVGGTSWREILWIKVYGGYGFKASDGNNLICSKIEIQT